LVTHNLALAKRADRTFVMERGVLGAIDLPRASRAPAPPARRFAPPPPANDPAPAVTAYDASRLGRSLWVVAERVMAAGLGIFALIFATNYGIGRYQDYQMQQRRDQLAALEELATSTLRGEIASVTRLGDGRYRVEIYLENKGGTDKPIYVMSQAVQAFVQVGLSWQELPLAAEGDATASVLKVVGRQSYQYVFEARLDKFTQLLPHYMHVRFINNMLVSPESAPKDDLFRREDNYYIYLRPDGIDDATITKSVKFAGPPPTWIWMPPH
jgi:putative ABC transport system ATP-binding protein/macrolide transport system ATP-binding/permease protein/lipoprotein-releasing system ATP-binding protein